jgi:hypothetical protein
LTAIVDRSPLAVPAAPEYVGKLLPVELLSAGLVSVTTGAVVSNVYGWPPTGKALLRAFPPASAIVPALTRLSAIDPLFAPVRPLVLTATTHDACGGEPLDGVTDVIVGVPVTLLDASAKSLAPTLLTGSVNITVQCNVLALVGLASAIAIDDTDGDEVSIVNVVVVAAD